MIKNITLKQLRIFSAVARELSFTRAAGCLNITQPAVSSQIQQLEDSISLVLFDRFGRSIRLSEAGIKLLEYTGEIERTLDKADETFSALKNMDAGILKVAAFNTVNYFGGSLVNAFGAKYPKVTVRYMVDKTPAIVQLLAEGNADVIIAGTLPPTHLNVVSKPFARRPYVIAASSKHPLSLSPRISLKQLFSEKFISRQPGASARVIVDRLAKETGVQYSIGLETSDNETLKQALISGEGVGCISRHTLSFELESKKLVILKVDGFPIVETWNVIYLQDRRLSPVACAFSEFLTSGGGGAVARIMAVDEPAMD